MDIDDFDDFLDFFPPPSVPPPKFVFSTIGIGGAAPPNTPLTRLGRFFTTGISPISGSSVRSTYTSNPPLAFNEDAFNEDEAPGPGMGTPMRQTTSENLLLAEAEAATEESQVEVVTNPQLGFLGHEAFFLAIVSANHVLLCFERKLEESISMPSRQRQHILQTRQVIQPDRGDGAWSGTGGGGGHEDGGLHHLSLCL